MEPAVARWIERRLAPTLAVCLALVLLEARLLPEAYTLWASNLLQLSLAVWASWASFRAGARERGLPRWFFGLFGLGLALWSLAQGILTLTGSATPPRLLVAVQDAIFVSSTAPLIAACALRPHRPRPGALGLAADVGLLCVLTFFIQVYFPFARQALGGPDSSPPALFVNPQRLMLLAGMLLFLRRGSSGDWRRLYDELGLAIAVYAGLGMLPNLDLVAGTYRPGLSDLPWSVPFLWLALAASDWQPREHEAAGTDEVDLAGWEAGDWKEARRGSTLALAAVVLVPAVHQLATLATLGTPVAPELAELRSRIALVGTLVVGGLYLVRQLHILRRVAGTQRAREERFRALVENSADAIGVVDGQGRLSYLSASSQRVTGHAPDELMLGSPLELVPPGEVDTLRRALAQVGAQPRASARGMLHYRHKDGSLRHGMIDAVNRLDSPAVAGIVLHLRDVTDERRAEEERQKSLSLLEATLESTADGILVIDRDGRIERSNQRFAALWRVPADVLAARDDARARDYVLEQLQEPQAFQDGVRALEAQPEAESFDTLRFKDGRVFERYSLPQRLAGEAVGRVWSFRDVSERAHAEEAMARLVAIIEATPDFVATCDAGLRPLYLNRAGRRMVGIGDEQPLAPSIAELHPPGARERLLAEAVPAALRDGVWSGETALCHRDGSDVPVLQVVLAHRSADGEVDFLSTIARDISQRMRSEQALRRSHTMAALGSLVAGVAHEVRNPLFGISSTLDAFEARLAGRDDHVPYARVLREQLDRMTGLMNDLLEYAKPTRLEPTQGRLDRVVASALAGCAELWKRAGVSVETRVPAELPPLRMDERRLTQALQNLLENAVQHSPAGGRVALEARQLRGRGGSWVECTVEDEGAGFTPSDLPHLFEPFYTRRPGGTGLGLSIVHRILTDHGGTIAAANRAERGARFTLTLPVVAEAAP
ncbi:MAG: PAS domain S-box protein [Burkholderiales bacterium]|jgi:PAS domain S-box-containing protein